MVYKEDRTLSGKDKEATHYSLLSTNNIRNKYIIN